MGVEHDVVNLTSWFILIVLGATVLTLLHALHSQGKDPLTRAQFQAGLLDHFTLLRQYRNQIMATLDQIKAAEAAEASEIAKMSAKLDLVFEALTALRNSGGATPAELDSLLKDITANTAAIVGEEGKADAALNPPAAPNTSLTFLSVSPGTLVTAFDPAVFSYTVEGLPVGTTSVSVSATAADSAATVSGAGSVTVAPGANTLSVTVSNGGASSVYTLVANVPTA